MDLVSILLLLVGGILCGVINVVGGGGSLFALPILLALGLPAQVANGTNRVAILFQDISSLVFFKKKRQLDIQEGWRLAIPTILGAVLGTWVASVYLTEMIMNISILVLIVFMITVLFFQPDKWTKKKNESLNYKLNFIDILVFFIIGFYGGFIQAGFTYLILAVLVLKVGNSMVKSDALKLFLNFLILPIALLIFAWHQQIDWLYGLVMGTGSALGGYWGVRFVTSWSPKLIRSILLILLILSALYIIFINKCICQTAFYTFFGGIKHQHTVCISIQ